MVDNLPKEVRSRIMASIRGKDTKPELVIRKILWSKGKRYRLHDRSVFGTPDISSKKKKLAVFIDGCFWHGCHRCYKEPTTNVGFWRSKIINNKKRRKHVVKNLRNDNWIVLEFWEHEVISTPESVAGRISKAL